jgi:AcrR family transcriptional regulator
MTTASTPPVHRQSRRSTPELRALLLAAARVEFGTKGFANTTNRDVAQRAGVAVSVLYRHFESKADLFSEAVLEPFVAGFEKLSYDWMRQLDEPMDDEALMQVFLRDVYGSVRANQHALDALRFARDDLPEAMTERIRSAFDRLITEVRVMAELEARRRGWMSADGIEMAVRVILGMVMGMSSYNWLLLPGGDAEGDAADVIEGMTKVGLWGLSRMGDHPTRGDDDQTVEGP